jgi:hypothetical protein
VSLTRKSGFVLINVVFDELVIVKIIQQFSADVMISGTLFYFIFFNFFLCVCVR